MTQLDASIIRPHLGIAPAQLGSRRWDGEPSRRPELQQRMHHYFEASCDSSPARTALEWEHGALTYAELDVAANRFAHVLLGFVDRPLSRVALMMPRSADLYVALLGIQKAGAAFVPIDPASPAERLHFVAEDSEVDLVVTSSDLAHLGEGLGVPVLVFDAERDAIGQAPSRRPLVEDPGDPTAYVIYTSGSSGHPKGVDIAQSSICNFLHVITEIYDVRPSDRVYQGMTIAFDFAIEEVWPTWAAGATLVAGPTDGRRVGAGLTTFLEDFGITLLYCVPTVLATMDRTIASVRGLMVGGEACPAELVERWAPGRRMLNTYGPTETTVTCTWGTLLPGRPVTIGVPVPTYTAIVLDEDRRPVPDGEVGELCIGGPGVARGYLNRPDLTADRFIQHPVDPRGGRIYRTGDLVHLDDNGEFVYLGRADAEVKIRGHRVDLGEIESVIMRDPAVSSAAVSTVSSPQTGDELVGFVVVDEGAPADLLDGLTERLHDRLTAALPGYMVPAFLEEIKGVPMLPSGKVDRKALPPPTSARILRTAGVTDPPATGTEQWVLSVWATVLGIEPQRLSVTADFFADLGGHSLPGARATSLLRQDERGAGMSVLDLYAHPTVRALATHLDNTAEAGSLGLLDESQAGRPGPGAAPGWGPPGETVTSRWRIAAFTAAQLVAIFIIVALSMLPISLIYWWHDGVPSRLMIEQILLSFPVAYLGERWLLPLLVARTAGRGIRPGSYPLYGLTHLRVWLVGKAMALSPLNHLAGSAFAAGYLRAAGAQIAEGAHICTALIALPHMVTVEQDATVGYATHLMGYSMTGSGLRVGRVVVGAGAMIAANCVLSGPCEVGSGAVVREQSALRPGQHIPDQETWQGSPALRRASTGDPVIELMASCHEAPREWSPQLRWRFVAGLVALELGPLATLFPIVIMVWWALLSAGELTALLLTLCTGPVFVLTVCAFVLFMRRFGLPHTPIGIHHLRSRLGVDKWFADKLLELSLLLTNTLYGTLFTPLWLRRLGAHVGPRTEVSTIANIDPDLLTLKEESFVADMASVGSATYCNNHVAFRPTTVGRRAFVGNASFVPSGTEMRDGSLLGVGSVPPASGVREGSSWLGSPAIFLPRREVYTEFGPTETFQPRRAQVIGRWAIESFRIVLPSTILAVSLFATLHAASTFAGQGASAWQLVLAVPGVALAFSVAVVLLVAILKWLVVGRYQPRVVPLWSNFVRRTEFITGIYEATAVPALLMMLSGTPLMGPALRLFGARIGRRCLIDTTYLTEFDLVHVADDVHVGPAVSLQTHLFEDRVMKMNTIDIDDGVVLEARTVVLYDTHVGAGAHLAPLSLVMKGETVPAGTRWAGIPAQRLPGPRPGEAA